jgi:hypothetical protein
LLPLEVAGIISHMARRRALPIPLPGITVDRSGERAGRREEARARVARLRSEGRCACGRKLRKGDKRSCSDCKARERLNSKIARERAAKARAERQDPRTSWPCGISLSHRQRAVLGLPTLREWRIARGLCPGCGGPLEQPVCRTCEEKTREYGRRYRERARGRYVSKPSRR